VLPGSVLKRITPNTDGTADLAITNSGDADFTYTVSGSSGSSIVINEVCNEPDFIELWNRGSDMIIGGWRINIIDNTGSTGSFVFPSGALLRAGKRLILTEFTGNVNDSTYYYGVNIGWSTGSIVSIALLDATGKGVDFVRTTSSTTLPPSGLAWYGSGINFSLYDAYRLKNKDSDSTTDWASSTSNSIFFLNPGQSEESQTPQWLSVVPTTGTVAAGQTNYVELQFNSSSMTNGLYQTTLHMLHTATNMPSPLDIPVALFIRNNGQFVSRVVDVGPNFSFAAFGQSHRLEGITVGRQTTGVLRGEQHILRLITR
jgi:hypothetical protein